MFSKRKKKVLKKLLVIFAIAAILGMNAVPFANAAENDSVASVSLLQGLGMTAKLGNVEKGTGPYTLDLTLTGTGTDIELVNPEKSVVIYADELAKLWAPNGTAHIKANLLPITLGSLPAVRDTVDNATNTLTTTVDQLVAIEEALLDRPILNNLIQIDGLTELSDALNKLNDLDVLLDSILVYEDDVAVTVDPSTGKVIVNFTDGLGDHLETTITAVIDLLNEVIGALENFNITIPILGPVLDGVLNGLLEPILGVGISLNDVLGLVTGLAGQLIDNAVTPLTSELTDLLNNLGSLQVLGETEITVPLKVAKPSGLGVTGDQNVVIDGIVTDTSAIDLDVLSDEGAHATVTFNEYTAVVTPPKPTPTPTPTTTTTTTTTTSGNKLPNTSTDMWIYGLTGISTMMAGIGTRYLGRRRKS